MTIRTRITCLIRLLLLAPMGMLHAQEFRPPATTAAGFLVPQPGRRFEFPRDHGRHDRFKVEWWYVTGHLAARDGREFGFQLTFFRTAGSPSSADPSPHPRFAHGPLHLGHCALLDVRERKFIHQSRLNREGWDAAAADTTLDVRNGNWSLALAPGAGERIRLAGSIRAEAGLDLELRSAKPIVSFGTNGVSRKGADATASSHYLTFTRLSVSGSVRIGTETLGVDGMAWMDHEFSSSQLGEGQTGWDWACMQFDDGTEAMAYRMRREDGSTDPFSTFAWIGADAVPRHSGPDRFKWEPTGTWESPLTGARYPNRVRITAPSPSGGPDRVLTLEPLFEAQELRDPLGGLAYWEGACRVRDAAGKVVGKAYLELAGYVGNLRDKLR